MLHRLLSSAYLCMCRSLLYWGSSCWEGRYPAQCCTHQHLEQTASHHVVACPVWHIRQHTLCTHLHTCGYIVPILPCTPHTGVGLNTQCTRLDNRAPERPTKHRSRRVVASFPCAAPVTPSRRERWQFYYQSSETVLLNDACVWNNTTLLHLNGVFAHWCVYLVLCILSKILILACTNSTLYNT